MELSPYEKTLLRCDGKLALTQRGRAVYDRRVKAVDGRIDRILGTGGPFSTAFKNAVLNDHYGLLERFYLEDELAGMKKILIALQRYPDDPDAHRLLKKLMRDPTKRSKPCVVCPVWRQKYSIDQLDIATRYMFPGIGGEFRLMTIMYDFAENLDELEAKIDEANRLMNSAVRHMTKRNRGVVVIGTLEPDLRSYSQLTTKKDLRSAMAAFGRIPPVGGGWVLSGHYLVRAPHIDEFEAFLDDALPGSGFDRVELKVISDTEDLLANVVKIMDYMAKYPDTLFGIPTRGMSRKLAEQELSKMVTAFRGFHLNTDDLDGSSFSVDAAIRQWAVFMDRVGFNKLYYSVENAHAQMWLSESELRVVRRYDIDTDTMGNELIEPFRNHYFDYSDAPGQKKTRKTGYLRTRRLRKDQAWIDATDMSKHEPGQPVLFTHWP